MYLRKTMLRLKDQKSNNFFNFFYKINFAVAVEKNLLILPLYTIQKIACRNFLNEG